jgi:hypothetical protein
VDAGALQDLGLAQNVLLVGPLLQPGNHNSSRFFSPCGTVQIVSVLAQEKAGTIT